jgi:predicted MPP superfamily phosphohydrolase
LVSPDLVLLGGDLVDGRSGLDALSDCVRALAERRPVAAVPGNHDVAAGLRAVRRRVLDSGGAWLPDRPLVLEGSGGARFRFSGAPRREDRGADVGIACLHDPAGAAAAARAGFALAFAGHLHGGQCVLFERRERLYPGAWFNRWTGLRFTIGRMRLFVSRGLGDTLPLRWNCPREVVVCDLVGAC